MTQEQLDNLFKQAKSAPLETSSQDVKKWIGYSAFTLLIVDVLSKLKVLTSKTIVMYSGIASIVGIGITALVISTSKPTPIERSANQNPSEKQVVYESTTVPEEAINLEENKLEDRYESTPILQEAFTTNFEFEPLKHFLAGPVFDKQLLASVPITQESYSKTLNPFSHLTVGGMFTLILIQGDEYSYRAEGNYTQDDLKVFWETKNTERLHIIYNSKKKTNENKRRKKTGVVDDTNVDDLTLYVTFKSLDQLTITGIVSATTDGKISGDKIKIEVGGASKLTTELAVNSLDIEVEGISKTVVGGQISNLKVNCDGASELEFLDANNLDATPINMRGISKLKLNANMLSLDLKMEGASDLELSGAASNSKLSISGTSNLDAEEFNTSDLTLKMNGAATAIFEANGEVKCQLSGTSNLTLKGKLSSIKMELTGASTAKMNGTLETLQLSCEGTSLFKANKLTISNAKVSLKGASSANLFVVGELDIDVSGTSHARLLNKPNQLLEKTKDAAKISK